MITILTISKSVELPFFLAYQEGVYSFKYLGDKEFVGDSQTWTWVGVVDEAPQVTGVRAGTVLLLQVNSLQDCLDNDQTFYYNIADGRLYVHWVDHAGDYSIGRDTASVQQSNLFYANGVDRVGMGYYDNTLYAPKIKELGGLSLKADPLKFGLVAQGMSNVSINNYNGEFDNIALTVSRGAVAEVFVVESKTDTLNNATQVFKGFTNSLSHSTKDLSIGLQEQRFFLNGSVCKNTYETAVGLEENKVGKPKPVAFGDIRRGICVPLDSDGVEKDDAATITFQVADPAIASILEISGLYDSNDNAVTLGTIDLVNCTVQYAKPAGVDIDLDEFSWSGKGYDLGDLTYNNGLDIIRFGFAQFGNTPFLSSTFDITEWGIATNANQQPVGLSIQSTRGFIEDILEPITVSLQGVVLTKGTGLITFIERDVDGAVKATFPYDKRLGDVKTQYNTRSFVSSLAVEFSRNFRKNTGILEENTDYEEDVIKDYGLQTRGNISPVRTVLRDRIDADAVSEEIMDTSKTPDKILSWSVKMFPDIMNLLPFDLVDIDAGRYDEPDRKLVELLTVAPNYNNYTINFSGRVLSDISDIINVPSVFGDALYGEMPYGG